MNVLILFAHPAFQKSFSNQQLLEGINLVEGVTFHDLYEEYPEFDIDIKREQELLSNHDCIIFHHPLFWYSTPALLKEWQDLVLEHGWAFGKDGNELRGKLFFNVITAGGPPSAYTREGFQYYTIKEFLAPLIQTAKLCKMHALPPFVVYGTHAINEQELHEYRENYHQLLKDIVNGNFDPDKMKSYDSLNEYLKGKEN
jgi:glutathione-regulated potassium-efflux system ancillary protein KefG